MEYLRCFFGLHNREVYKEEVVKNYKNEIVGKVIITRCIKCGKMEAKYIKLIDNI